MKRTSQTALLVFSIFLCSLLLFFAVYGAFTIFMGNGTLTLRPEKSGDIASWFQAIGSISAIVGAFIVGSLQAASAHKSALSLEELRESKRHSGNLGVIKNLIKETADFYTLTLTAKKDDEVTKEWNIFRSNTFQAALDAFDSMPVYELGTTERVACAFQIRQFAALTFDVGATWSQESELEVSEDQIEIDPDKPNSGVEKGNQSRLKQVRAEMLNSMAHLVVFEQRLDDQYPTIPTESVTLKDVLKPSNRRGAQDGAGT